MSKRTSIILPDEIVERIEYIKKHMGIQTRSGAISIAVTNYYNNLLLQGHEIIKNNKKIRDEQNELT